MATISTHNDPKSRRRYLIRSFTLAALHALIVFHGGGPPYRARIFARPTCLRSALQVNARQIDFCSQRIPRRARSDAGKTFDHGSSRGPFRRSPSPRQRSKPVGKDDLQTLPLAEVEKKLGSSPDGLTQAEAQKRLTQYGPNEIAEKKTNEILKFLSYFWGPIPWMIEAAVILSAAAQHWPDFGIILLLLLANAMVGFWEEHQAGNAIAALKATLAIKARVKRDGKWVNPAARELVPGDAIRLRLGDIVPADARLLGRRRDIRRPVGADRGIHARHAEIGRRRLLRVDRSSRRNRRAGLRDRRQNLFWQDGGTGGDGGHRQPFPESRAEDRQLPDYPRADPCGRDHRTWSLPRRADPHRVAVRARADGRGHPRGDADGPVGDHGGRRAPARQETGDREQTGRDRGIGGRGRALRRQDRNAHPEQADARRTVLP